MTYNLLIRPEARLDILDAFKWYQARNIELGHDFKSCVDEVMSILQQNPNIYPKVYENIRRGFMKRFPFGIFYVVDNTTVIVLAVIHARRNPDTWKLRAPKHQQ